MRLNFFVRVWYDMWKYLDRESKMILSVTLTCYEYISLLTRYQPSQRATESCDYVFTGSKDALCIQPSALEMYVNANICAPCPSFRIVT